MWGGKEHPSTPVYWLKIYIHLYCSRYRSFTRTSPPVNEEKGWKKPDDRCYIYTTNLGVSGGIWFSPGTFTSDVHRLFVLSSSHPWTFDTWSMSEKLTSLLIDSVIKQQQQRPPTIGWLCGNYTINSILIQMEDRDKIIDRNRWIGR